MTQTPSNTGRFVRAAWALLSFQVIASIGAVGVTGWAALYVQEIAGADGEGEAPADGPASDAVLEETDLPQSDDGQVTPAQTPEPPFEQANLPASISISGVAQERETLSAVLGPDPDGGGEEGSFQWLRDGQAIVGAQGAMYALSAADVWRQISVQANYTDGAGKPEQVGSDPVQPQPVNDGDATIAVRRETVATIIDALIGQWLNGDSAPRYTYTAVLGPDPDGAGAQPRFQWLRDGDPIPGAGSATYRTEPADEGRMLAVRADYTDAQGYDESVMSEPLAVPLNDEGEPSE